MRKIQRTKCETTGVHTSHVLQIFFNVDEVSLFSPFHATRNRVYIQTMGVKKDYSNKKAVKKISF
jgi:hypothetical protein